MPAYKEISVQDLKKKLDSNQAIVLIDVRESYEKAISDIGGQLIPLSCFETEFAKLEPQKDAEIILYCRSGGRSGQAASFLISKGYKNVTNVLGGINKWAIEIDSNVATY